MELWACLAHWFPWRWIAVSRLESIWRLPLSQSVWLQMESSLLWCVTNLIRSFQEDSGIKNCAWASDSMNLFEKLASKVRPLLYEILDSGDDIPDFNDECLKSILSFICQETESDTEL